MAENLTVSELASALRAPEPLQAPFRVLRSLATYVSLGGAPPSTSRDLVIRLLARREELNGYGEVVDSLAVAVGLYPYADPAQLGAPEILAYESHRPVGLDDDDLVFHQAQAAVYEALMDGESVVLSAPTSFGKSLIVDAILASGRFHNVAVVVPTIALIDETRRRIAKRFAGRYKVITHPSQEVSERNVLVMTQERLLDVPELPPLDLFVIDEFYKLDPSEDRGRSNLLNQAFYRLRRTGAPFYLLGPSIKEMPVELNAMARVVITDFSTVSLDVRRVARTGDDLRTLVQLCAQLTEPTLIYCKSPPQARDVALALAHADAAGGEADVDDAATWIGETYHPEWSFVRALRRGVGLHHGRIPRSLGQFVVRAFNDGLLRILVCTSTLIEGVNTTAKNVIIFDNKLANRRFDFFTFNNIKGRGGRMFSHYIGHVYLFHDPPSEQLPTVDIPVLTQPEGTDTSLLIQLEEDDRLERSKAALEDLLRQPELPLEDIRNNSGIDPELLIQLAKDLRASPGLRRRLTWSGFPEWEDLLEVSRVVWDHLGGGKQARRDYVKTHRQLAYRLNRLRFDGVAGLVEVEIGEHGDPDKAVEDVLDFVRQVAGFHFPRLLMAVDRVHRRVTGELAEPSSAYAFYAAQVESLFKPRALVALEEYGIPMQVADRIDRVVSLDVGLDAALDVIRRIDLDRFDLSPFERKMVDDARESL